jgi:menaquinone-specific isochorismate synthase
MSPAAAATGEERALDAATFALLRSHAFSHGCVFEREGCSLFGFGRAEEIELPHGLSDPSALEEVTARLSRLAAPEVAGGVVAVGALPFLPAAPASLHVPEVTVVRQRGSVTALVVAGSGEHTAVFDRLVSEAHPRAGGPPPDDFRLASARPHADYLARVEDAVGEVRGGRFDKVVLAREVVIEANRPFREGDLLERLRSLHPSCTTFCVDGFLGATPELLLRRSGSEIASDPLAGTAARSGDFEADRRAEEDLMSSSKERTEHRAVVEEIASGLAPVVERLEVPESPEIVELRNVSHLRTRIRGVLARNRAAGMPSALEVLALIHPTPAVSGSPVDVALEYLAKSEELDRGRYAGPVGWVRADGDGEFHLGIRSASVSGTRASLLAGAGIVADSDPEAELRETQLKLQAVLAAAVRP